MKKIDVAELCKVILIVKVGRVSVGTIESEPFELLNNLK